MALNSGAKGLNIFMQAVLTSCHESLQEMFFVQNHPNAIPIMREWKTIDHN
jgi:hypothetical protein